MSYFTRHISRCFLAGLVALLPIGGFILTVVYLESAISGSWLAGHWWYVPGLGLVAAAAGIYAIGLTVSTFIGRWAWTKLDYLLDSLPMLGRLYQTLKQIVGYSEGKDAIFQRVVLVSNGDDAGAELGLVTNESTAPDGRLQLLVFVPGAPNPTTGRLVLIDASEVKPVSLPVSDTMKLLLSLGKTTFPATPNDEARMTKQ
ncbi:MAG: DUF502 domain-containing protein [Planctomycetaceae bacterium]